MSRKEARRPGVVQLAVAGKITTAEGARGLEMSLRQFRRLKAGYRAEGVRGLVHRRRGQPSGRGLDVELRARIIELVQTTYRDFNDCHATEKLRGLEGLPVSRSTVRRLRRARGLPPKRRRRPRQHRARRPRHPALGSLGLVDGSRVRLARHGDPCTAPRRHRRCDEHRPGAALPARGGSPRLSHPARASRRAPRAAGDPLRRSPRRLRPQRRPLERGGGAAGRPAPPQFGQVLRDLAIGFIGAHSPQAKGRIERRWETLPDRLVAELRWHGSRPSRRPKPSCPPTSSTTTAASRRRRPTRPPVLRQNRVRFAWRRSVLLGQAQHARRLMCGLVRGRAVSASSGHRPPPRLAVDLSARPVCCGAAAG